MMSKKDNEAITRQAALNKIGKAAKKLGITTSPLLALGATAEQDAGGIDEAEITRLLNDILHMKFLLQLFYSIPDNINQLIPPPFVSSFEAIKGHHHSHVIFVKNFIGHYGSIHMITPFLDADFNTTDLNPADNFDDFLQIAQVLEDASASLFKKTCRNFIN